MITPRILATTNEGKKREWNSILKSFGGTWSVTCVSEKQELVEIQHVDPVAVAVPKAIHGYQHYKTPVLVEDTAFSLDELNGFPGALYAPVEKSLGLDGLLHLARLCPKRLATVTSTIAFADIDCTRVYIVKAQIYGTVPQEKRGTNGFGFDSIFVPQGHHHTFAEMSEQEKDGCSMRRLAIQKMLDNAWQVLEVSK